VFKETAMQVAKLQEDMEARGKAAIVEMEEAVTTALAGKVDRAAKHGKNPGTSRVSGKIYGVDLRQLRSQN
jgi:hypothetical protein